MLLITGVAGFIGFHLAYKHLLAGHAIIGIDDLNDYYDVALKKARLAQCQAFPQFTFYQADIADAQALNKIFKRHKPTEVANLAAQAGVRYSLTHPETYVHSNLVGFSTVIEACRQHEVLHLVYASSSSVYGAKTEAPSNESEASNQPLSLYAATKKANELTAHAYSHLYGLATTGLRFFTVYGPWGRPDMAFFSFTRNILAGLPIDVYNFGDMKRDFTYIDDIVDGIDKAFCESQQTSQSNTYKIYNLGHGEAIPLLDYIAAIEKACGKEAIKVFLPLQAGDVLTSWADTHKAKKELNYKPSVHYEEGLTRFVAWYRQFYHC